MSFCSLGGMLGELLEMDAVLLDLNFEAVEGSLGFEQSGLLVGHGSDSTVRAHGKKRMEDFESKHQSS